MIDYAPPKIQLTLEHQNLCVKTLKFLHELTPEIQKLKQAGIDTTTWEQLHSRLMEINQSIANNFCRNTPVE